MGLFVPCLVKGARSLFSRVIQSLPQQGIISARAFSLLPSVGFHLEPDKISTTVSRTVTKFSLKTGNRKSAGAVLVRFYRLNNGLWIRRIAGCHSAKHKKSNYQRWLEDQHVVCTRRQCIMFDKMVTKNYKKKKFYIDDEFEPYQTRNNFDYVLPYENK